MRLPPFQTTQNQSGRKLTPDQLAALAAGRAKRHQQRAPKLCSCGAEIKPGPNYSKVKYCSPKCAARGKEVRENGRRCGLNHGRQALARYRENHPEWRAAVGARSRKRWEAFREERRADDDYFRSGTRYPGQ